MDASFCRGGYGCNFRPAFNRLPENVDRTSGSFTGVLVDARRVLLQVRSAAGDPASRKAAVCADQKNGRMSLSKRMDA